MSLCCIIYSVYQTIYETYQGNNVTLCVTVYIYYDSNLLVPVFCFAELIQISLWAISTLTGFSLKLPNSNSVDNFASLDTPGSSGGVKVVEWNQNQLMRSLWGESLRRVTKVSHWADSTNIHPRVTRKSPESHIRFKQEPHESHLRKSPKRVTHESHGGESPLRVTHESQLGLCSELLRKVQAWKSHLGNSLRRVT